MEPKVMWKRGDVRIVQVPRERYLKVEERKYDSLGIESWHSLPLGDQRTAELENAVRGLYRAKQKLRDDDY